MCVAGGGCWGGCWGGGFSWCVGGRGEGGIMFVYVGVCWEGVGVGGFSWCVGGREEGGIVLYVGCVGRGQVVRGYVCVCWGVGRTVVVCGGGGVKGAPPPPLLECQGGRHLPAHLVEVSGYFPGSQCFPACWSLVT